MQKIFKDPPYKLVVQMTKQQLQSVKAKAHEQKVTVSQYIRLICK
jgi:hypothetical protein